MTRNVPQPSPELIRTVRIGFIRQNTTFTTWCNRNGVRTSNARAALIGLWNGPKGRAMRKRIVDAARISEAA